jgi:hypothetical protein
MNAQVEPVFTFDAETHTYRLDGAEVPSVTAVIKSAQLVDGRWFGDEHRLRGQIIHIACALWDRGNLDDSPLEPDLLGYVEAWKRFRAETKFEPLQIEEARFHQLLRYAGTIDRVGVRMRYRIVLDIKTGEVMPWHAIQLAAYANLLESPMSYERWTVGLRPDATYKIHVSPKAEFGADLAVFASALTIHNYKRRHNL